MFIRNVCNNYYQKNPADAHKLTHRFLLKEHFPQNPPPYAEMNSPLPQVTEMQQHFQP